jgi:fatty acid synthase subunit alpha, fungi type
MLDIKRDGLIPLTAILLVTSYVALKTDSVEDLDWEPRAVIGAFLETFPESNDQVMTREDLLYFLTIASIPYRKPMPFIPIIDETFEIWLKKDSLWQSEDVEAVVGQDAGRVVILQGPVAVKYANKVETVKDILRGIYTEQIAGIKRRYYPTGSTMAKVEYLGRAEPIDFKRLRNVSFTKPSADSLMIELPGENSLLPNAYEYFEALAGSHTGWARALLTADNILRGSLLISNPVKRLLQPRCNQSVLISYADGRPFTFKVYNATSDAHQEPMPAVSITCDSEGYIALVICERKGTTIVPLEFKFHYRPCQGVTHIHEIMSNRNQRIKEFYARLWDLDVKHAGTSKHQFTSKFVVDANHVEAFTDSIRNNSQLYQLKNGELEAPLDFAIVASWKSLVSALLPADIDGDLLQLVHLSNDFRTLCISSSMNAADVLDSCASIRSVEISASGKTVEVSSIISKLGVPIIEVLSKFLLRGKFDDIQSNFQSSEKTFELDLSSTKALAGLKSKSWINWNAACPELKIGHRLVFKLHNKAQVNSLYPESSHLQVSGQVMLQTKLEDIHVGKVSYESENCQGNVVLEYLKRNGAVVDNEIYFDARYALIPADTVSIDVVPQNNRSYAASSLDSNPIHVNPYFASLADLPGTITHGMWTSACSRKVVEQYAAENDPKRIKVYRVKFVGMVQPGDVLSHKLFHVGMVNGRKLVKIDTYNQREELVLAGKAEVEQPVIAYVFTGQGSQETGMGMDLYNSSKVARNIWNAADTYTREEYGLSIIHIVRDNPKSLTVHFGGALGSAIRKRYLGMTYDTVQINGSIAKIPIFPEISIGSKSYTFYHPNGLLAGTQLSKFSYAIHTAGSDTHSTSFLPRS